MKKFLLALAAIVFRSLVKHATPALRSYLKDILIKFKEKAAVTSNEFDDILANALYRLLFGNE